MNIFRGRLLRKNPATKKSKNSLDFQQNGPKNLRFSIFLIISENPDLGDVQIRTKHYEINENSKFQKKNENINLELPFGEGFDGFH